MFRLKISEKKQNINSSYFAQELQTNQAYYDGQYRTDKSFANEVPLQAGQEMGEFNLGSTIVLVFEAPKRLMHWTASEDEKIQYGQRICQF